jgi:tRNA-dihydrouridine synthase 3
MNERPPMYFGRDELETLMASPYVNDWIKITEMLLGPAPKDFHFIPKHKSNAYEAPQTSEA